MYVYARILSLSHQVIQLGAISSAERTKAVLLSPLHWRFLKIDTVYLNAVQDPHPARFVAAAATPIEHTVADAVHTQ